MEKMRLRKEMMALEMRIQEMDNVILRKELKCKDEWKNRITLELEN